MSYRQTLIFSDLDGTLLDHFTYQSTAAQPTLEKLAVANIPVILTTSKTYAEVKVLQQKLALTTPFIIENGAAIYIPIGTFAQQPEGTELKGGYWVKSFCSGHEHWLALLAKHSGEFQGCYQSFSNMSVPELSVLTGLTPEEAERAKQREYGEPIHWLGDNQTKQQFIEKLTAMGASVLHGGRFIHIAGHCDKGQALAWLTNQYRKEFTANSSQKPSMRTIALGDGENDVAMLQAADCAVQIRSPVHSFPHLNRQQFVMQTRHFGPEGWAEAISFLLADQLTSNSRNLEVNHG